MRYLPIVAAITWLGGSILLFAEGPYVYPVSNPGTLWAYLLAVHLFLIVGYVSGAQQLERTYAGKLRMGRVLRLGAAATAAKGLAAIALGEATALNATTALSNPASAYAAFAATQGAVVHPYIDMCIAPLSVAFYVLCVYRWKIETRTVKILFAVLMLFDLATAVGIAVRGAIVTKMIVIGGAYLTVWSQDGSRRGDLWRALKAIVACTCAIGVTLWYFGVLYSNRGGYSSAGYNPVIGQYPEPSHILSRMPQGEGKTLVLGMVTYLTHGYYGLSLALTKKTENVGLGLSNSLFLQRNFARLTGSDYPARVSFASRLAEEDGYPVGNYWMSFYPWLASDVTWLGSILVVCLIGRCFATSWLDATKGRNPVAAIAFVLLAQIVYAFPMNNPLQDGAGLSKFWVWMIVYYSSRGTPVRRINVRIRTLPHSIHWGRCQRPRPDRESDAYSESRCCMRSPTT